MCNQCSNLDPRDEIAYGAKALRGIRDLVTEIHQGTNGFQTNDVGGLAELLDMVETRISKAADALQSFSPPIAPQ